MKAVSAGRISAMETPWKTKCLTFPVWKFIGNPLFFNQTGISMRNENRADKFFGFFYSFPEVCLQRS